MKRATKIAFLILLFSMILFTSRLFAQVVTSDPQFPVDSDTVTVYFHAKEGTGGLAGYTGDVYAHTGVITNLSTSSSDWRYVKTQWGDNTPATKMTRISTDEYKITIKNIRKYYGVPSSEKILKMAFVFRSGVQVNGNYLQGKDTGGKDIFVDVYQGGVHVKLLQPSTNPTFVEKGSTLNFMGIGSISGSTSSSLSLKLMVNGTQVASAQNDTLSYSMSASSIGRYDVQLIGSVSGGQTDTATSAYMVNPPVVNQPRPDTLKDGITYYPNDPTKVTLSLFAPHKKFVYVIGDFNNWRVNPQYFMKRDSVNADSTWYWITINNLTPGKQYSFQYLINGNLRVADPYSQLVLDPNNDKNISSTTYPNLKPYPYGKTSHIVGVMQPGEKNFQWTDQNYKRPSKKKLVIYELWLDDFVKSHNYKTLTDTLSYFQNLGVNAIELMPITEFEGNISWGYNPIFYFAPDKYYGTADELKQFINACHNHDIAVIMDMVLNHSYGESPMVRMYFNNGHPAADSPWFNETSPNTAFSYGYDFNHESKATQYFVGRVLRYWMKNFHVDGYRFDFAKGFTNTPGDGYAYDQSRINILEHYANDMWKTDSTAYDILELFTANSEEKVLSNYGMMIWGNENTSYSQAAIGYANGPSGTNWTWNFSGASYENRGWSKPNLIAYMESHDEQRVMYKALQYGNSSGTYNIKDLATALNRIKLNAAFFFTIPGPKMIWEFEELGYDYSINWPSNTSSDRTTPKPIRWDYFTNGKRKDLYKVFKSLIDLKKKYPVFNSSNFTMDTQNAVKRIQITGDTMDVNIIGNFDVTSHSAAANFQKKGTWYDYFTGKAVQVSNTSMSVDLEPGQFHIYTTSKLPTPPKGILTSVQSNKTQANLPTKFKLYQNYPNPFNPSTNIRYELPKSSNVTLDIYNILGQKVATLYHQQIQRAGTHMISFNADHLSSGTYFIRLKAAGHTMIRKMMLLK